MAWALPKYCLSIAWIWPAAIEYLEHSCRVRVQYPGHLTTRFLQYRNHYSTICAANRERTCCLYALLPRCLEIKKPPAQTGGKNKKNNILYDVIHYASA